MKYSEFIEKVGELGYEVELVSDTNILIKSEIGTVLSVQKNKRFKFDVDWLAFGRLTTCEQKELFVIACELAVTPPTEREEEKRYYLKFLLPPLMKDLYLADNYVNVYRNSQEISLSTDKKDTDCFKTIFTESEISQMDITGFVKEVIE